MSPDDPNTKAWRLAQAQKEEDRHEEVKRKLEELKVPHWTVKPTFWITIVSAVAAVAAAYFAWVAVRHEEKPAPVTATTPPASSIR